MLGPSRAFGRADNRARPESVYPIRNTSVAIVVGCAIAIYAAAKWLDRSQ